MPYIKQEDRSKYVDVLHSVAEVFHQSVTPGDLNYLLTKIALLYTETKGVNYTHLNDVIGVLESCKQEFYRRKVAPYEDKKVKDNGDCYNGK